MVWLEAMGFPNTAVETIRLKVRGTLGGLRARPGERLAEALLRLAAETPRQRLDDVRGELRVEELLALDATHPVARLEAPLVAHLDERGLVVLPARLSDPEAGSEITVRSDHVSLHSLLELFVGQVAEGVTGELDGEAHVRGPLHDPSFRGSLSLVGLDARLPYLASRLQGEVNLRADAAGAYLEAPGLKVDEVPISLAASLPTSGPGADVADAQLSARGLVLRRGRSRVGPADVDLGAGFSLDSLTGRLVGAVEVKGGTLVLDDLGPVGILREALARQRAAAGSPTTISPPGTAAAVSDLPSVPLESGHVVDLRLRLSSPLLVRSPLADVAVEGEVAVQRQPGVPLFVEGEVQLRRGSVFLHRHEFRIVEGRVEARLAGGFFSSSVRARAEADVAQHKIRLEVGGSLDEPQVTWRSTPARTEAEITHLLATGTLPGEGRALSSAARGVADFFTTTSLNRMLSSSLGLSSVRLRRDGNVSRFDVDKQIDDRTVVTYSRGTDSSDRLSIERRVGGTTTVEGGRKRDQEGARPFIGIKRRLRFR
jgi:autotransporter translocation and assembly factor TamB